jgi:multiple sugar transport system ATP-binding protein
MDEPLSNLDAQLRSDTRSQIVQLQKQLQVTTIYVTHDQYGLAADEFSACKS